MPGFLDEYLVKLGFAPDMVGYGKFSAVLRDASSLTEATGFRITRSFLKWQGEITGAFGAIAAGAVGVADRVAMADQEYRLFALRMYTTIPIARELKIATDALGQPLENIAWDPELARRFNQLVQDQRALTKELGPSFEAQMLRIRDLRFEFSRFGVELKYLTMLVVKDFAKAFGMDMDQLFSRMRNFNNWLIANLPRASDWLVTRLKPILLDVKEVLEDTWRVVGLTGQAFANLVGVLSGDTSLEGTAVSFDKIARAVQTALGWVRDFVEGIISAEEAALHVINAAALLKDRKYKEAGEEMSKAGKAITPLGGLVGGMAVGGAVGAPFAGVGAIPGAAIGGALGLWTGIQAQYNQSTEQARRDFLMEVQTTAKYAAQRLGIPSDLVLAQWMHETGGLSSIAAAYNLGGIRLPGSKTYQQFSDLKAFADRYVQILSGSRYAGMAKPTNPDEMAAYLKRGSYYEAPQSEYAAGLRRFDKPEGATPTVTMYTDVTVQVTHPGATAAEIGAEVKKGVQEGQAKRVQRNLQEFQSPGWSY
jgi:hypothetical protein